MATHKIISGYLAGKNIKIEDTIENMFGIKDILTDSRSYDNTAISMYMLKDSPYNGPIYYGKIDGVGYCVHGSWIRKL